MNAEKEDEDGLIWIWFSKDDEPIDEDYARMQLAELFKSL